MKSLHDQIADKCIHFTGLMNDTCKAGIGYDDVKDKSVKPFKIPCIKNTERTGGHCSLCRLRTEEQIQERLNEIDKMSLGALSNVVAIKAHIEKTKQKEGIIKCAACGGEMKYAQSEYNAHIWARCSSCGLSFNE